MVWKIVILSIAIVIASFIMSRCNCGYSGSIWELRALTILEVKDSETRGKI